MQENDSGIKEVTRGGQLTLHSLRMFGQVIKSVLWGTVLIWFIIFYWLFSGRTTDYDLYIVGQYIEAEMKIVVHDTRVKHVVKDPDGLAVELKAIDFVHSTKVKQYLEKCKKAFWSSFLQSVLVALFVLGFLMF